MRQPINPVRQQRGLTLIEMLVALILLVIAIAAATGRVGGVFGKSDATEEVANLNMLIVNAKTLRSAGGYGASGTDLVPSLIATKGVPKGMLSGSAIMNKWDASVSVTSTGAGFAVTESGLSQADCIELANKISKGGALTTKINANAAVSGDVASTTATAQCTDSATNTIVFTAQN